MKLFLVQHGKAKTEEEDIKRPLNEEGIKQTEITAQKFILKNYGNVYEILHSGKLRAQQTAEIMEKIIKSENGIRQVDNLNPNDNPEIWFNKISYLKENTMMVGHLPHLKKLCSLLVYNTTENENINFVNSGIVCLEKKGDKWEIIDIILP